MRNNKQLIYLIKIPEKNYSFLSMSFYNYYMNKFLLLLTFLLLSSCKLAKQDDSGLVEGDKKSSEEKTPREVRTTQLKNFAIYYGNLSALNSDVNNWDNDLVAEDINQYDIFIIGKIENPGHADYTNTQEILAQIDGSTKVFGRIDIGNTNMRSMDDLKLSVDRFKELGAYGIFLDEMGFEYWDDPILMRRRQNKIIDYIHGKNMQVIASAANPADLFSSVASIPIHLGSNDYYLFEDFFYNSTQEFDFGFHIQKLKKLAQATKNFGIKVLAASYNSESSTQFNETDFTVMALAAAIEGHYAIAWGTANYSASGADQGILRYHAIPSESSFTYFSDENLIYDGRESIIARNGPAGKYIVDFYHMSYEIP